MTGRGIQPPASTLPPRAVAPSGSARSTPLRNRFLTMMARIRRRPSAPEEAPRSRRTESQVPILLVSLGETDRLSVCEFLLGTRFLPVYACSLDEGSRLMSHVLFPILLYDPLPHPDEWQSRLGRFLGILRQPVVLLLDSPGHVDSYENSVCRASFGVLPRPLQPESLIAALNLAYTKWSVGFAHSRTPCRALAAASASAPDALCGRLPGCILPLD